MLDACNTRELYLYALTDTLNHTPPPRVIVSKETIRFQNKLFQSSGVFSSARGVNNCV